MSISIKNLAFLKNSRPDHPEYSVKLAEALESFGLQVNNAISQTNANPTGSPEPPPNINAVNVTAQNGFAHVAIQHDAPIYRGVRYYVEHADNPNFTNPQVVALHDVRNVTIPVGAGNRYYRAYAAYSSSAPGAPAYHGNPVQPTAVDAGGSGPAFLPSQGSGTGEAGVGLQGPGTRPFRPVSGSPPTR